MVQPSDTQRLARALNWEYSAISLMMVHRLALLEYRRGERGTKPEQPHAPRLGASPGILGIGHHGTKSGDPDRNGIEAQRSAFGSALRAFTEGQRSLREFGETPVESVRDTDNDGSEIRRCSTRGFRDIGDALDQARG